MYASEYVSVYMYVCMILVAVYVYVFCVMVSGFRSLFSEFDLSGV